MKKARIILCLLLAAVMLTAAALSAHAVPAPIYIGDLDLDQDITVLDATRIQRWLAGLENPLMRWYKPAPQKLQEYIGDANRDGSCDILDATFIQRFLAGLENVRKGDLGTWAYYISPTRFYANYDSGKATVGKPVTFTAEIPGYSFVPENDPTVPYTYEFRINGKTVQERSDKNTLTYTFTEAGGYEVTAVFYNALDAERTHSFGRMTEVGYYEYPYRVVEPYSLEKPVIVYADFPEDTETITCTGPLTVRAEGGSGGYQYKVDLKGRDFIPGNGWTQTDADTLTTGWVDSSSFTIPDSEGLYPRGELTVTARDSDGAESEPVRIEYFPDYAIE